MQDFKHLSHKKSLKFSRFLGKSSRNFNRKSPPSPDPQNSRRRLLLPVIALLLAMVPILGVLLSSHETKSAQQKEQRVTSSKVLDSYQAFKLAVDCLAVSSHNGQCLAAPLSDGGSVTYSIDAEVQGRVKKVMEQNRVPYAVFIAIEPKTGRILALAGHSSLDPAWQQRCFFSTYPMASLFKIVTAAAALEEKKVSPQTVVAFGGRLTSENPKYWAPGRGSQQMDLTAALGKSVNPVFGRLASDVVGRDSLMSFVDRFGFNQTLLPGVPVLPSPARMPESTADLQRMGAGLVHEVKISPLHAAMMMAAIANDGVMLVPSLAREIKNGNGEVISAREPQVLRRLVASETATGLAKMLSTTVSTGTSRKIFHDRRGRPLLASIDIAAKTGSINGTDPSGHYSWFTAYAPIHDPQIALAAMVINQDKWRIKASYLGEQALEAFFR